MDDELSEDRKWLKELAELNSQLTAAWKEYISESQHEGTEVSLEDFGLYLQHRNATK